MAARLQAERAARESASREVDRRVVDIVESKNEIANLKTALDAEKRISAVSQERISSQEKDLDTYRDTIYTLKKSLESLETKGEAAKMVSLATDLADSRQRLQSSNEESQATIASLRAEIETLRRPAVVEEQLEVKRKSVEKELEDAKQDLEEAKQALDMSAQEVKDAREAPELRSALKKADAKVASLTRDNIMKKEQTAALQRELEVQRQASETARSFLQSEREVLISTIFNEFFILFRLIDANFVTNF